MTRSPLRPMKILLITTIKIHCGKTNRLNEVCSRTVIILVTQYGVGFIANNTLINSSLFHCDGGFGCWFCFHPMCPYYYLEHIVNDPYFGSNMRSRLHLTEIRHVVPLFVTKPFIFWTNRRIDTTSRVFGVRSKYSTPSSLLIIQIPKLTSND